MSNETYNGFDVSESEENTEVEQEESTEEQEEVESRESDDESDEQSKEKAKTVPVTPPAKRKVRVKVDGKESEVDEDEIVRDYQKFRAADKKFQEAAKLRKDAEALIDLLKNDPVKALEHPSIGKNFKELAENYLIEQLKREQMTPEQRELMEARQKLEQFEKAQQEQQKQFEEQKMAELANHYEQEYQKSIIDALQNSGLPKTNVTVRRMAYYMHRALEQGYEVSAKDVVSLVKKDYHREIQELLGAADGDILEGLLGDVSKKLRKMDVHKAKTQLQTEDDEDVQVTPKTEKKGPKKISMDEFDDYLKNL